MPRGFLLQAAARVDAGRTVIELWGKLEGGGTFLVRDRRFRPYLFVRAADTARAGIAGAKPCPVPLTTMSGDPVVRIEESTPALLARLRDRLEGAGIAVFEGDLRPTARYLIDRGIRGALAVAGPSLPGPGGSLLFEDPELGPADFAPDLSVLALDIETDPTASRLLSFALHGAGAAEVHLVLPAARPLPPGVTAHPGEIALLGALEERVRAVEPDVLTGWNVVGFDLAVLERRSRALDRTLRLGRGPAPLAVTVGRRLRGASRAEVEGRAVLDGVDLLRGAFVAVEDYRLETVARTVLGEGKLLHGPDRAGEIERLHRDDPAALAAYNLRDAELVTRILDRTGLVPLAVRRSLLTGLPLERVGASIAALDSLYLPELRARGVVAPCVASGEAAAPAAATAGGAVLEPVAGLHERVLGFDFKSLYPSLIRTYNIDPLSHVLSDGGGATGLIRTPAGERFRREPAILPALLARLMAERAAARARGDAVASQAIKILMNSFYGVLAAPACRFHSPRLANAITATGQAILLRTRDRFEALGHPVLYGDTDSLFVRSGADSDAAALATGQRLAARVNAELARDLEAEQGLSSHLDLELEAVWTKLFFPHLRHGAGGARKRYAGLVLEDGGERLVFVGMESVRRDSTALARRFQHGLYERLFRGRPVAEFVRETLAELRSGARDEELVYRKALRKDLADYTATTPPHVRAARLGGGRGRIVEYVWTTGGPEPVSARRHPIDREHYVEKQIRPIAEAVLPALGLRWEDVAGEPRQLGLFGPSPAS